ncbi:MAG: hypothetical protein ACKVP0_21145 [Pirellulaceae bacterium]
MSKFPLDFDPRPAPLPPYGGPTSRPTELFGWLLGISAIQALMNLSILPVIERSGPDDLRAWWGTFCIGSIGGQAGTLAILAVLGPASTLRRHLVAVSLGLGMALAWFVGLLISQSMYGRHFPEMVNVAGMLLVIPLLFCVCELPLWFFRTFLRWRLELPAEGRTRPPQLTIAGILIATAAVALSLGAVRLGDKLAGGGSEAHWWMGVAFASAWCGGFSLVVLPVVVPLIFRTQSLMIGLLVASAWMGLLMTTLLIVMSALSGYFPKRELHLIVCIALGFLFTLLGPLALCRLYGYRLRWGREAR